jgi:3-oxoacyl-[acyl-carrier protein] reductase
VRGPAVAIRADSSDGETVRNAVAETVWAFSRLAVLVSKAGIAIVAPVGEFWLQVGARTVAVNVRGVFVAAQELAPDARWGHIIVIGSVNAGRMPFAGGIAMLRAAVAGFSRDLGRRDITGQQRATGGRHRPEPWVVG